MSLSRSILATEIKLGAHQLRNRVIMAPLTRMRSSIEFSPTDLMVDYYRQRASAGLIITEGSQVSQQGQGYPLTPGIYNDNQVKAWKKVTSAIQEQGGLVFLQLWHVGRVSHSAFQPNYQLPVAPSSLAAVGDAFLPDFSRVPYELPHALTADEIQGIVQDFKQAAIHAREAGFDGVEIHAANGYLIEQFLKSVSNQRTDEYGGSNENRARFLFEVLDAVLSVWPHDRVAVRLSPFYTGTIESERDPLPFYDEIVKRLNGYRLAYLHIIESKGSEAAFNHIDSSAVMEGTLIEHIRSIYSNPIIAAGGFNKERAEKVIEQGFADAIAFGRGFISTPDLAYRLIHGIQPNELHKNTIYGGTSVGYTDYKTHIPE